MRSAVSILLFDVFLVSAPLLSEEPSGAIEGRVTDEDGGALPGVTVEAASPALPAPRVGVTGAAGE
jgi:hypothetical protein